MDYSGYPNRLHTIFAVPVGLCSIGTCYFGSQLLDSGDFSLAIGYLVFAGIALLLGKFLMDTAKYHVDFTDEGIIVVQSSRSEPVFLPWENICFACRTRSRKGHTCLILSGKPLDTY